MVTISNLRNALANPADSFRTIKEIVWDNAPIIRSTYFAETRIKIGNYPYLLYMPLTSVATHRAELFCKLKRHLKSSLVPPMRIMRDEMLYTDTLGNELSCDILLEPLSCTMAYSDAVANAKFDKAEAGSLLTAIDTLENELISIDVSHNNLRKENLCIDENGLLHPIRWYHATKQAGGDQEAFKQLRNEILCNQQELEVKDSQQSYSTPVELDGHIAIRTVSEGLIAVEDESGWGFVDCNNNYVVESKYGWVSDFKEGRAEVELNGAMGLIDKMGNHVLEPIYDILDYNHISGLSRAKINGSWYLFDYSGVEIQDLSTEKETEEDAEPEYQAQEAP